MTNYCYIQDKDTAKSIDNLAINSYQIPALILMEHAASTSVKFIKEKISKDNKILVLCGFGNNGGDGLAISRLLSHEGYKVSIYCPQIEKMSKECLIQYQICQNLAIPITFKLEECLRWIKQNDIIIDCLFGYGLNRAIEGDFKTIITYCNQSNKIVFSIDMPSGICASSGNILGVAIKADYTITLDCYKIGQFINHGPAHCHEIIKADIMIPAELHQKINKNLIYFDKPLAQEFFPPRFKYSHKGTYKKCLMIGGCIQMHGALSLCAKACYHSGIGTLTLFIPDCIGDIIASKLEIAMNIRAQSSNGFFAEDSYKLLEEVIDKYDIVTIGNGMGQNQATINLLKVALRSDKTLIIDADALWALKHCLPLLQKRKNTTILTPHLKEMTYLTNYSKEDIVIDPLKTCKEFCNDYPNAILVLKSFATFISDNKQTFLFSKPNSSLAKGGSGDVLCGIITGLVAQNQDPLKCSAVACYCLNEAANCDKDPCALQPLDLIQNLNKVFIDLRIKKDVE